MTAENNQKNLKLNPRLAKIAELLPNCRSVADIGTDHAYIPIYALLKGKAEYAIASDINRGPVERAGKNARLFGLEDKLSLRLGPGLETLSAGDAEVIVIAGMGGILISEILENSKAVALSAKYLVLQPMTAAKELREYLCKNNFAIESEALVAEEDKLYNILCVRPGGKSEYTEKELILGKGLEKADPQLYRRYFAGIERKLKIRLSGLESSDLPQNQEMANEVRGQIELINN